jgi:predicted O-methyltransferase YrrM
MNRFLFKQLSSFLNYKVQRPHRNGHGIHSPFLFNFVTETLYKKKQSKRIINPIEKIRKEMLKNNDLIVIEDLGAGSTRLKQNHRKISDVARISSSSKKYGMLLHKIVDYCKPEIVIELGTCLGIGTMYMASGSEQAKIYSIEGSQSLLDLAQKNIQKANLSNIFLQKGNFGEVLPSLLKEHGKFDLMYMDGNHRKEAVLNYFSMSLPYTQDNSVMIIDDIRWAEDMFDAWFEICKNEHVKVSLDLQNTGIIFFNRKLRKQHFKVYY